MSTAAAREAFVFGALMHWACWEAAADNGKERHRSFTVTRRAFDWTVTLRAGGWTLEAEGQTMHEIWRKLHANASGRLDALDLS